MNHIKPYKFHLEPYRNSSQKHHCPICEKKTFVRYVDDKGNYIADEVGRCDRQDACRYHLTPKQYFKQHPNIRGNDDWKKNYTYTMRKEEPPRPINYIPNKYVEAISNEEYLKNNNLYHFFNIFGKENAQREFIKYHVGTSKHWRSTDGKGLATAFPQIDIDGHIRQIKAIMYNPTTGHRLHDNDLAEVQLGSTKQYHSDTSNSKVWFAGKTIMRREGITNPNLQQTFFGAHLLPTVNNVCIVESEKTAMIADIYTDDPDTAWIATGGKNGCRWTTWEVCQVLQGKRVTLYPDLKCYDDWNAKAGLLRTYGIDVYTSHVLEELCTEQDREQGLDIADFLMRER